MPVKERMENLFNLLQEEIEKDVVDFKFNNAAIALVDDKLVQEEEGKKVLLLAYSNLNNFTDSLYENVSSSIKRINEELHIKQDALNSEALSLDIEKIILVTITKDYFPLERLNEDLEFKRVSEESKNSSYEEKKKTCCERKIMEYIACNYRNKIAGNLVKKHSYDKSDAQLEAEKNKLEGDIRIYTILEPCIFCYRLLTDLKKKEKLNIKVNYEKQPTRSPLFEELLDMAKTLYEFSKEKGVNGIDLKDLIDMLENEK
ncbi:hypothetical protein DXT76_10755 [Halobacillus trueperi]|uniref:Uncharacterized protein n=1 Tax=Halobacillus trueperi TaxID=156205 RepID=A0A3D8VN80_9BACI|nr:hypothetical protein [Halobacillus trueperi]RDY70856.1 hypothetical protein DXT76_10755 [Halobacillus trueperi]